MFVIAILIVVLLYGGVNYWIGLRAWQGLFKYLPHAASWRPYYWIFFFLIAFFYILGRLIQKYLPANLNRVIAYIGAYWLAAMFYLILFLLFWETLKRVNQFVHIIPTTLEMRPTFQVALSLVVLVALTSLLAYGTWNAQNPRIQHYDLRINKTAGNLENLHMVMVSDIHLGTINQNKTLNGLITRVNALKPDIIVFAGDVFDENGEVFVEQKMAVPFQSLKAPYGIYAVLGNHEYIGGHAEEVIHYLEEAGIKVLRDQTIEIAGSFNLVGRDDLSKSSINGQKRADLQALLKDSNSQLPIVVLDHQPSHLEEPEQAGVDLQLSGHTHHGQLWPVQWITQRIFEKDWGLLEKDSFHLIVSDGYGTWGPPIRIGNQPEIVDLQIQFGPHR
ncbi:metallophosphoesterase [Desulfitobacterium sp.]|uniref:metallophosphoesterase n=1 Tax=Desulfitobacterium sp. TaxID=49981 RepID=UPI002C067BD7|nr:metallophosphoesterase [Desulfitobacterium sp.]HVJ48536.1 metallophosphoesterase [Desulfitobacterium sp.]